MNIKKVIAVLLVLSGCLILSSNANAASDDISVAQGMVQRIFGAQGSKIDLELISPENGNDVFELESIDGKVVVRGNSALALAAGLNWYLKYYCYTTVSWYADDPIQLPEKLPDVDKKIRKKSECEYRFFLNYCTFGYTMPWWNWQDWERLIDWMALNGINMPLAITGQEAIWQKVWKDFGFTDEQIRGYFTGPAHLPWHRMANIDGWSSPLPQSYIDNQLVLQKRILKREREFNMKPVLPAFAGHVPGFLKKKYPDSKISKLNAWGGFSEPYHPYFLDPKDPLFTQVQKKFLEEQIKQFGTDHIYGTDPFNEMIPPSWEPAYLADVASTIYNSMAAVDTDAQWLQMGWLFYYAAKHWTQPRIEALLTAVPQGKMILLDYYCDYKEVWKRTKAFYGQPYIWCYLGNFGGNTYLTGNIQDVNERVANVFTSNQRGNIKGIGSTLEGFDLNPVMYDFVFEKAWDQEAVDLEKWMMQYARRRCGQPDEKLEQAWQILLNEVYKKPSRSAHGSMINARPSLTAAGSRYSNPKIYYDNIHLLKVWKLMLEAENKNRDSYQYDLVNVAGQVLSNYAVIVRDKLSADFKARDKAAFEKSAKELLDIISDMDKLVSTRSERLMGAWLEDAKSFGKNEAERNLYEWNARNIVTTWGEKDRILNDYANRSWAGLLGDYYYTRWQMFLDKLKLSLENNTEFDQKVFNAEVAEFEVGWASSHQKYNAKPIGDSYDLASSLYAKYASKVRETK